MSVGQWIEWPGGPCPVPPETLVQIRTLDGQTGIFTAADCALHPDWWSDQHRARWIAAYRVIETDGPGEDLCGVTTREEIQA